MKTNELISYINEGKLDDRLMDIYLDKDKLSYQRDRYIKAVESYMELYKNSPSYTDEICIVSAPGRTEVGGNHTDHQHGEVLAASINDDAVAIVGKNEQNSNMVYIKSEGYDMITISLDDTSKKDEEEGTTLALIKGVIAGCQNRGYKIGGFNAYITSDVLGGSGLSSSAAFETVIGNIISHLFNDGTIDAVTIAIIGQYAENYYFGKPCGLMDQMACSVGSLSHIDFNKNEEYTYENGTVDQRPFIEKIELDLDTVGYSLCITDTKGSHADLTPDYAAVPAEMKSVAAFFGKEYLIDVPEHDVIDNITALRDKLGDRAVLRALHFYDETARAGKEAAYLQKHEQVTNKKENTHFFDKFLEEVQKSGDSSYKYLQNVYTCHDSLHQNVAVALYFSQNTLGEAGGASRVHGGGFAGTIQAFVNNHFVEKYKSTMDKLFGDGACAILKIRKFGGIKVI